MGINELNRKILRILVRFLKPFLRLFASLFYDKKYLYGKYFDESLIGWRWTYRGILWQKIFGFNRNVPWPVSPFLIINNPSNITFDNDTLNNFQMGGSYFAPGLGRIIIGKNTWIGPNAGIIATNHDLVDPSKNQPPEEVIIGENCWIGMNAVILPGVILGNHTVVGAGSVVTKSFHQGNVVIAGNPARVIKIIKIDSDIN